MSRDRWVVLAAALGGLAVALAVTLLQEPTYRASGTLVLTREGRAPGDDPTLAPAAAAAEELLATHGIAASVVANLRLDDSPGELLDRIDVDSSAQSSLLRVSVDGADEQRARRIAQELTEVFTVLYNTRFGPGVTVSIWEAPHVEEDPVGSGPARNLAVGGLLGALAGLVLGALGRRPGRQGRAVRPKPQPAREPAPVEAPRPAVAEVAPEQPRAPFVRPDFGAWRLADVEALVAEHGHAFPDRREELDVYLASFRDVAGPDGRLPAGVQLLVEEFFADVIEHAGR